MADKKTEVATTGAVDENLPSYLRNYAGPKTKDNFDSSDTVIPRVKLLQGLSAECETHDAAKPGFFWHTGLDESLGADFEFVIVSRKKKYLLVTPMEDGQGVLARAEDFTTWDRMGSWDVKIDKKTTVKWTIDDLNVVKSGLDAWGTSDPDDENSPPAATLFYEYLIIVPDRMELGPMMMSLTRSSVKIAKKELNSKISLHLGAGRPLQSVKFKAASKGDSNDDGQDFKNWSFMGAGFADEELFKTAMMLAETLTDYKVEGEEEEGAGEKAAPAESKDF